MPQKKRQFQIVKLDGSFQSECNVLQTANGTNLGSKQASHASDSTIQTSQGGQFINVWRGLNGYPPRQK